MKHVRLLFLWIICTVTYLKANADVRLPRLISSGMVLQRDVKIPVWGWADAGEKITVTFLYKTYTTITDKNGKWQIKLDKASAGGPYSMMIQGNNTIRLTDILMGDVWLCSGQSNMEFLMERVKEKYADIIAHAANGFVRQFWVKPYADFQGPKEDVDAHSITWTKADPKTVLNFTAVGYFFALELFEKYKIPVGIINSSLGGTPVEAWLSSDALRQFPDLYSIYKKYGDTTYTSDIVGKNYRLTRSWNDSLQLKDKGLHEPVKWYDNRYKPEGWKNIVLPDYYTGIHRKDSSGAFWYRKEIILPDDVTDKKAMLRLGNIEMSDTTYLNGIKIGSVRTKYTPRVYDIPKGILKGGKNIITVRVVKMQNTGGFIIDKPYQLEVDNKKYSLAGSWLYKAGVVLPSTHSSIAVSHGPGGLYNAMIAPLIDYNIKGILWYQGEGNTGNPKPYYNWFTTLILDWRTKWRNDSLPFFYAQISSYGHPEQHPVESGWAAVREAQLKALSLPNTGMAVTFDIGEWNDVHPLDKLDVGKRLFLAAEKVAYHINEIIFSGPIYKSMSIQADTIIIDFKYKNKGLIAKDGDTLRQFAIAGQNGKYIWAHAVIKDNKVYVWNENVLHPSKVRYAWADTPLGANLYNEEGLPASPFSSDEDDNPDKRNKLF